MVARVLWCLGVDRGKTTTEADPCGMTNKRTGNGKDSMEESYIPTHVAVKLRHGWGTRSFWVGTTT